MRRLPGQTCLFSQNFNKIRRIFCNPGWEWGHTERPPHLMSWVCSFVLLLAISLASFSLLMTRHAHYNGPHAQPFAEGEKISRHAF
jgi:hypothetical protein